LSVFAHGLQNVEVIEADDPGATLRPDGREPFVAAIEPVRMSKTADATVESVPAPPRLAVDIRNISLTFETSDGKVDALSNVSLQIADGEFVSFIGPSGCGKTPMLRVIADLQQPTTGTPLVNGVSAETGAAGAPVWLCVPGAGFVSVANDREEFETAAGGHGFFR